MPGLARFHASVADSTALYVCSGDRRQVMDRVIWRISADLRGSFPGYLNVADALLGARVELSPNYLFVNTSSHSFAIPTSAIERVALISGIDRPNGAILLVDYCDSTRTIRRFWLRDGRPRVPSPSSSRLRRFATQFAEAGVGRIDTGDLVTGFSHSIPPADSRSAEQARVEWSGRATISLASGDYLAAVSLVDGWFRGSVSNTEIGIKIAEIAGFTVAENRSEGRSENVFLTFWDDDTRVDLRLSLWADASSDSVSPGQEFVASLRHFGVPNFSEDPGALTRARSESRHSYIDATGEGKAGARGAAGVYEIQRWRPSAGTGTNQPDTAEPHADAVTQDRFVADPESQHVALRQHITARLEALRSLRDSELISDEDWQQQRALILLEIDVTDRLFQLRVLRDSGVISSEEHDAKRAELIQAL